MKQRLQYIFLVATVLISIRLWSFQPVPSIVYNLLNILIVGLIVFMVFNFYATGRRIGKQAFKLSVNLFLILPLLSTLGAYVYHDQSLLASLLALRLNFLWLLYFLLHFFNFSPAKLIKMLLVIGAVWAVVTIVQQFTYPVYFFYSRDEETRQLLRAGIYRFMAFRHHYGLFLAIYAFYKFNTVQHKKVIYGAIFLLGMLGLYYFGTRQFLASAILAVGYLIFISNKNQKGYAILLTTIIVTIGVFFSEALFGRFIKMTQEDLSEDNIRILAANFYLNEYWPENWFSRIIGNGLNYYDNTEYGKEVTYYEEAGLFRADVGVIGVFNLYGLFYVFASFYFVIKGLTIKYVSNSYLKAVYLAILVTTPLSVYFDNYTAIPFFAILAYLTDKSVLNTNIT
ncbi:MAG: hypothetical protein VYB38_12530 [Bacteroidota bacterium]|mgnify:CR=1 FL=1|nr:hypothetical protein [Bacteroidota bacterium]